MAILLDPLKQALHSLDVATQKIKDEFIRDSVIQRFEFSYEMAWKTMQRWLKENIGPEVADPLTRKELFRLAAERGLIENPLQWEKFHEARNLTAHTYHEETAEEVYDLAKVFLKHGEALLAKLRENNDESFA